MKRHYRIGETVRYVTGRTGDVLPRAIVVSRYGTGRTRRGAPWYTLQRGGDTLQTSGSNIYPDAPEVEEWAQQLIAYEALCGELEAERQAVLDDLEARQAPRRRAAFDALKGAHDVRLYR